MSFPPLQWAFDVFNIHLITLENQKLIVDQFHSWLIYVGYHFKGYSKKIPLQPFDQQHPFQFQLMDASDNNI